MPRLTARTRVSVCLACGLVAFGVAMALLAWQVAVLLGWDVAAATWMAWIGASIAGKDSVATRQMATKEDDSRTAADLMLLGASVASLIGVLFLLLKAAQESGTAHTLMTVLAAATVVFSWATIHMLFTLRYARLYYQHDGGIDFHDDRKADYGDFAYVAFTVGMTYQVSDTDLVAKPIRMTALRQALLAYLFGTVVIATTINMVAGFLSK